MFHVDTVCEKFLINDCFVEELIWLGEGVEMNILGKSYFVQVRLVWHGYDTKQLEPSIGCSSMAKKGDPCPMCASVVGCLSHEMDKTVFSNDRHKLPLNHALRSCGTTGCCCPKDYYTINNTTRGVVDHPINPDQLTVSQKYGTKITAAQLRPCDDTNSEKIISIIKDDKKPYAWYHSRYSFGTFSNSVWTAYYDYRPFCPFKRISQDKYKEYTEAAMRQGNSVNGFHTKWPFDRLKYMDFGRMINWDPFHSMKNVAKHLFSLLNGTREVQASAVSYYSRIKIFPFLYHNSDTNMKSVTEERGPKSVSEVRGPWAVLSTKHLQSRIDEYISSIMYPTGFSQHFSIKGVFLQIGMLKGAQLVQAASKLMDLIIYAIRRELQPDMIKKIDPYLAFFSLAGEDLCLLQQPQFKDCDIEPLYYRLVELVGLHHLLFGAYEALITLHQLTDLPPFIREFGPIRGWSTLAAERAIGKVKKHLTQGGVHLHLTVFDREVSAESSNLKAAYSRQPSVSATLAKMINKLKDPETTIIDQETNKLTYSYQLFKLSDLYDEPTVLSDIEVSKLLLLLVYEVRKAVNFDEEQALKQSGLFRLHYSFQQLRSRKKSNSNRQYTKENFYGWLKDSSSMLSLLTIIDKKVEIDSDIRAWLQDGAVIKDDLEIALSVFTKPEGFKVNVYKTAIIFGTTINSRGIECREVEEGRRDGRYGQENIIPKVNNDANILRKHFWDKTHYSSWFSFSPKLSNDKDQKMREELDQDSDRVDQISANVARFNKTLEQVSSVGQFNGFFRCHLIHEPLLHGIPCGFMTGRRSKIVEHSIIQITCDNQCYSDKYFFVPLTDVYSTHIGIVAINNKNKPISRDTIDNKRHENNIYLQELLLIELNKERKCIVYNSSDIKKYNNMDYDKS